MPTKILVADDSATMRRVLEMTFAGEDASVVTVDSGDAALAKAAENPPDVVFADASMTGVDGYELARRIKANPNLARTAVILMASQHSPYDDGKGRAAGVDDHISKPFDTQSVIDRVGQVLSRPRAGGAETSRVAATPAAAPAAPRPVAASPVAAPTPASPRSPMQTTRMGIGVAPVAAAPVQAPPQARPAPQAAPVAPMRPAATTAPMMPMTAGPAASAKPMTASVSQSALPQSTPPRPAAAVAQASVDMAAKLQNLGLTREQIEGVLALSREVIEQVVWEVVPDLAEQLIREEIKRLTTD